MNLPTVRPAISFQGTNFFGPGASLSSLDYFPTVPARQRPQRRKPGNDDGLTFHVDTNLVTIDLVATDKSGHVIPNLKPEELEVFDEGKRQVISRMTLEQRARLDRVAKPVTASAEPGGARVYDNFSHLENWTGPVNVLLLDSLNTPLASQAYVRSEMLKLLKAMPLEQPIAVYMLGRKLTLLQDFTSDPQILRAAATRFTPHNAGLRLDAGSPSLPDFGIQMPENQYESLVAFEQEDAAFALDERLAITVDAFNAIARHAAGFPGRKNLIWVSSTFPLDVMGDWQLPGSGPVRSYYQTVHDLSSMLSDAHIAVYPVDAEGLRALSTFDAAQSGRVNGRLATGPEFMAMTSQAAAGIEAAHFTMQDIAEQTGGRAFYNRNDLDKAVLAAAEDGSSYYALAFRPEKYVADGRMHELKLKCKRSGVQLLYRRGYFALDPYDPRHPDPDRLKWMQSEMRDALIAQKQLETGVPLQAALQNESHAELLLQPGALTFGAEPAGRHRATIEIVTAAFDEKGKALAMDAHVYQVVLEDDKYKQAVSMPLRQPVTFPTRPDAKRLRIAVRDLTTDRIGTVDVPLAPSGDH